MLLYFNDNGVIYRYNEVISREDASEILGHSPNNTVWYDDEEAVFQAEDMIGKRKRFIYEDGEVKIVYEDIPEPPTPEPTDTELIMQTLFDSELRDFEGTEERALLAQQMTDIELAILGGYTS